MDTKRLFVGNITGDTTENDLQKAFERYGTIQSIELKEKANLVDPDNPTYFAFININIDDFLLNKCLNRFSEKDFNGQFLNVSLAKESFLDRLKREREEKESGNTNSVNNKTNSFNKVENYKERRSIQSKASNVRAKKRKTFDSDDEIFQDESLHQTSLGYDLEYDKSSYKKPLNDNEKRIESLKKMQDEYVHKKMLIQQSLSGVDFDKSKKVKFDFYQSDEEEEKISLNKSKKVDLFDKEDYEENHQVNLKKFLKQKEQLKSIGGEKLLKMQSHFNGDDRFKMDTNFLEGDNDETKESENDEEDGDDYSNEKATQIRIMEEIVGRKLTRVVDPNRKELPKTMIRYDPKNEEHKILINSMSSNKSGKNSLELQVNKSTSSGTQSQNQPKTDVEVSKDQFYTINDDLKNSLKRRGDGFSLLSIFGNPDNSHKNDKKDKETVEKIFIKDSNKQFLKVEANPFKFDSSDSEDDDIIIEKSEKETTKANKKNKSSTKDKKGKTSKSGILLENFFIIGGDKRLKEGAEFFKNKKQKDNENGEEKPGYDKVMEKLRLIINKKISKSKKPIQGKHIFKKKSKSK